jgi:signal transduction histidine kinase
MPATSPLPALDAPSVDPKVEFFLTASHQLKSPVAIMQWCLQSMTEIQNLDPEAKKLVQKSLEQANSMSHLIGDMLQVFRLMNGKHKTTAEAVNLNELLAEVLQTYELLSHNKGVHLVRGTVEQLPVVFGTKTLVKQCIINLVDNAIKYTPAGSQVIVSAATEGDHAVIHVSDQGIGIPEAEQSRLFTEFFRGEEAKEIAYEGTGLGLVLVKHIMASMGGEVTFKSVFHKGTDFTLRFPFRVS